MSGFCHCDQISEGKYLNVILVTVLEILIQLFLLRGWDGAKNHRGGAWQSMAEHNFSPHIGQEAKIGKMEKPGTK